MRTNSLNPVVSVPGAGTLFALRAIGIILVVRWLFSMSRMDFLAVLINMASSPWACIHLVFLFLLVILPGAKARAERPFHPLPHWLRQTLQALALLVLLFSAWQIGKFAYSAGVRRTLHAIVQDNGWLMVVMPAVYIAVIWICRPRALWHTNIAAQHFAIGRYAVSLDQATRTAIVWAENRKTGQYDARELTLRWMRGGRLARVGLWWDSPAAAGRRQCIFRTLFWSGKTHMAALALEAVLRQSKMP